MKKLLLFLVLGIAPAFVQPAAAQIVAVPPCVPTTTCLLNTDNVFLGRNQFNKGIVPGQLTVSQLQALPSPSFGTLATVLNAASSSDCTAGSGTSTVVCMFAGSWIAVGTGAGGVNCPAGTPAIPYFDSTANQLKCDQFARSDGAGNWILASLSVTGTLAGNRLATTGTGGILDLQFQTPPATVPANHAYVIANSITGLVDCLTGVVSPTHCISSVQLLGSGAVAMPTAAIASPGCSSAVTLTATGATTGSHIIATPNVNPTGVTGYSPSTGSLYIDAWVTANTANFEVCNPPGGVTVTPGALTLNVAVF